MEKEDIELFVWDDEKVAEVARKIWEEKKDAVMWTSDLTAELSIIKRYKFEKITRSLIDDLGTEKFSDSRFIVDIEKLEDLLRYLIKKTEFKK